MVVSSIFLLLKNLVMNNNPLAEIFWNFLNTILLYIVIVLLILLLIVWVLYYFWIFDKFFSYDRYQMKKEKNPFDLVIEWKVFTNTELKFFNELSKIINNYDYYLFTKIRLIDLVKLKNADYWEYMSIFNKLSKKHIDFIIVDKYWKVKVLIELDDKYHRKYKAVKNDEFKNELASYLNIPLIRFNAWKYYNFDKLVTIL